MVWANGMPAIAHPDAVVISTLIVHIIPDGATPFDFRANMEYAPTLLPIAYGKIKILFFREIPIKSCEGSDTTPVCVSTDDRKLRGFFV